MRCLPRPGNGTAIQVGREAVEATPADHPGRALCLSNLEIALRTRFGRTGDLGDIDAAVALGREAVEATPADHPDWALYLTTLGSSLLNRFERTGVLADLDAAIQANGTALGATPTGHPDRAGRLSNLGIALRARFERTGKPADLDVAIQTASAAVDATPTTNTAGAYRLCLDKVPARLVVSASSRARGDISDCPFLCGCYTTNTLPAVSVEGSGDRARRDRLVRDLRERVLKFMGDPALLLDPRVPGLARDLAEIITRSSQAGAAPDVEAMHVLAAVHWYRYHLLPEGQDQDDLQAALSWYGELLQAAPDLVPDPVRAAFTRTDTPPGGTGDDVAAEATNRAIAQIREYERTGNTRHLHAAVERFRAAVRATPTGDPNRPRRLSNLAAALRSRYERVGEPADLDEAITIGRTALQATPAGHPNRPSVLSNLAAALRSRYERGGDLAVLDEATNRLREAVRATPAGHPNRPSVLSNLAAALRSRYERGGDLAVLDEATNRLREAVRATPAGHPDHPMYLSNLGNVLRSRYERARDPANLDEAITVGWQAVEATPTGDPNRTRYVSNLAAALLSRYERTGDPAVLNDAFEKFREAIQFTPTGNPDRPGMLSALGNALGARYERAGDPADLDEAITVGRQAVQATPTDYPDRPGVLSNLAAALGARYKQAGDLADLDEAIDRFREVVQATPAGHPDRPMYLSNLGNALHTRYKRAGDVADLADLNAAIDRFQEAEAIQATRTGHPNRLAVLSNLAAALHTRYERAGDPADLNAAIEKFREAIQTTPTNHPNLTGHLSSLGIALRTRYERAGDPGDLDEAITVGWQAVEATPTGHPDRSGRLANLGNTFRVRYERTRNLADLGEAIGAWREGAHVVTAPPAARLDVARAWAWWALQAGDPTEGLAGYTMAVEELLPLAAWHGLDQATRRYHLEQHRGLAVQAAACAVAADNPTRAVELVEAGRQVLWTQALHLRQDLDSLRSQRRALAERLDKARAMLDASPTHASGSLDNAAAAVAGGPSDDGRAAEQRMLEERRHAAQDWDATVEQVRQEGFEDFLRPVPFTRLRQAAVDGPVVIVNITASYSHALLITPPSEEQPGPTVVELPAAPYDTVAEQANTLLAAREATNPTVDWQQRKDDRQAVFDVLAWTWQAITEPVLTALGYTDTPTGPVEDWPRVWWCPTGPASGLPLHAAGHHPRTRSQYEKMGEAAAIRNTVAGRVVSSYTPSLAALIRARTRPAPQQVQVLAVGVPDAPGQDPLPAVHAELQALVDALPRSTRRTPLVGVAATRQAVKDTMPEHTWLHLSCHGDQDPIDASRSAFLLYDQPLTLADLATLNLPQADLAYLAACQTATGDVRLPDEALHLAAALQLVGYRHVLATLWNISDIAAPAIAHAIYTHLAHPDPNHPRPDDHPDSAHAAHAVHHAVTHLRQALPSEPLVWAPYIHLGP